METQLKKNHMQWAVDYQKFLESGMTQQEWCSLKNINLRTFQCRLTTLRRLYGMEKKKGCAEGTFAELLPPPADCGAASSECRRGAAEEEHVLLEAGSRRISIPAGVSDSRARLVLEVFLNAQ